MEIIWLIIWAENMTIPVPSLIMQSAAVKAKPNDDESENINNRKTKLNESKPDRRAPARVSPNEFTRSGA